MPSSPIVSGSYSCPALLVSAPASGQGKTTVTAALAHWHRERGKRVTVFKTGPDFIDPMVLEQASGRPVVQLDLWMGGEAHCRQLLAHAAAESDLILIEGVMGLFDGSNSSAALAELFGIPVLAVIDGSAMAQTFGAIAHGLKTYRPSLTLFGVFANKVGSEGHATMLTESLVDLPLIGWLPRDANIELPERHLGLQLAEEIPQLGQKIQAASNALKGDLELLPAPVNFQVSTEEQPPKLLSNTRIAIARDSAFCFVYIANLRLLEAMGATLSYFSPLSDTDLPACDAVYLPGGYPELHLEQLAANQAMAQALKQHHASGKPMLAECGGMLYLLESMQTFDQPPQAMVGLIAGSGTMAKKFTNLGMQSVTFPNGELRGHTFHYGAIEHRETIDLQSTPARHHGKSEVVIQKSQLTASFLHFYFPSNPRAAAALFRPEK